MSFCHILLRRSFYFNHKSKFYHKFAINNFDEYFTQDFSEFKNTISKRQLNCKLDYLHTKYAAYKKVLKEIEDLNKEKAMTAEAMKNVVKGTDESSAKQTDLKSKGRIVRENIKKMMDDENILRMELLPLIHEIPAILDHNAPEKDMIIREYCSDGSKTKKTHLELCGNLIKLRTHCLNNTKPIVVAYLTKELSLLEHELYFKLLNSLGELEGYRNLARSDIVKEFATEACICKEDEKPLKIIGDSADEVSDPFSSQVLMLTGVSSPGFLGFLSTLNMQSSFLPQKFYSIGRNYRSGGNPQYGLYDLSQTIQGELFCMDKNSEASDVVYEKQKSFTSSLYDFLQLPIKIVEVGAKNLQKNESRRTEFHVWSPGFNRFFECGYVTSHGDHVSRMLSLKQSDSRNFNTLNHSVVFKLPTVMAALVEQKQSYKDLFQRRN